MPFLTKKSEGSEAGTFLHNVSGSSRGSVWDGDVYSPSKGTGIFGTATGSSFSAQVQHKRLCGNAECANGWTMPWRNRKRPIFEAQWGCSGRCVLAMVQAAVRRELGDGDISAAPALHRHRVPLGLLMLGQGWITHPQLQRALAAQRENGSGRIGDWLISECGVEPERIVRGLSLQWGCAVLTPEGFSPEVMARVVPRVFVERFGMLPLRVAGSRILYLGFADRLDASAALVTERMSELKVESGVVEGAQFEAARRQLLECEGVEMKLEEGRDKDSIAARITAVLEQQQPIASRLVRLHHYYWLRMWLERGAIGRVGSLPSSGEDVMDHVFSVGAPA